MILILRGPGDEDASAIQNELERRGVEIARLDPDLLTGIGAVSLSLAGAGRLEGVIRPSGGEVHIEEITAVWLGRQGPFGSSRLLDNLWDVIDAPVLPGLPSAIAGAGQELRQMRAACAAGFDIPATTVTADDARTHSARGEVSGKCRLRITVVGKKAYAASIHSSSAAGQSFDAWRYDDDASIVAYALPATEVSRCLQLTDLLELDYATIDAVLSKDNEIIFLGLDPHGDFLVIEEATSMPITRAVADLLLERHNEREWDVDFDNLHDAERGPTTLRSLFRTHSAQHRHPSFAGPRKAHV